MIKIDVICETDEVKVICSNGKYGIADKNDNIIVSCRYDDIFPFDEGLLRIRINDRYGFINSYGKEISPCKYEDVWLSREGLRKVRLNNKFGFIDKDGKEIVPCKYNFAWRFEEGFTVVGVALSRFNKKYGFINKKGEELTPCKYEFAERFEGEIARIYINGKHGFINREGEEFFLDKIKTMNPRSSFLHYAKYYDTIIFDSGEFIGDKEQFIKYIKKEYSDSEYMNEYLICIKNIENKFK